MKGIHCLPEAPQWEANNTYFPILVQNEYPLTRDALFERLGQANIHTRRYFYPLISDFPMYRNLPSASHANLPVARAAAERVLCLPMSSNFTVDDAERVVACITGA